MALAVGDWHAPDEAEIITQVQACLRPFQLTKGEVEIIRESLYDVMWEQVGIVRDAAGLRAAEQELEELGTALAKTGVAGDDRAFHLGWHDWLNLENLITVSRSIAAAAAARTNSCGAHYRSDHTRPPSREGLSYVSVSLDDGVLHIAHKEVFYSRVQPGQSLLTPVIVGQSPT